ncbi:hypothetical protein GCM10007962_04420 [Yeosuana aromativorans]|uniref:Cytochrome c domain-containing protein n=1 Tax=Yeosuana aromativorans TaxID=288019 RepID=A0A8J3FH84_9FLAO|nr:cytochrome c [Yeosuana aromativorans]GGK13218.1 hypothetical protein GCM10007962_04420 [Yeosuana aromativorans]
MSKSLKYVSLFLIVLLISCGDNEKNEKEGFSYEKKTESKSSVSETTLLASQKTDLNNKGTGPITSMELPETIDQDMARNGERLFMKLCTACHRPDKKFIGPEPKGIMDRRTPEWIMNMILNPEEMLRKDPLAKELLVEFNYAPMIKQEVTQEDARAILEYYRTLN